MSAADTVLLVGGTGALGRPLVSALAGRGARLVVVSRHPAPAGLPGVEHVRGDVLAGDTLGLDGAIGARLRDDVTAIVHAAALTRFDAPLDAVRAANVEGTRAVLAFAARCRRVPRVCALSTIYVAGRRTGLVREADLEHDRGFVNPYEQSKYEAERLLREWMPRLPIAVCRLSTVLGDSATGRVERAAAIHQAIRFLYRSLVPMMPGAADSPVDLVASDYAAAVVGHLANDGFESGATFHVCAGGDTIDQQALVDLTVSSFLRHRPAWRRRAIEKPDIVALETFELFRQSVDEVADPGLRAAVDVLARFAPQLAFPKRFDDEGCRRALAAAGLERPGIAATLDKVIQNLIACNWEPAGSAGGWSAA